jgi:uncharacterized small protein (DUF1192 family)
MTKFDLQTITGSGWPAVAEYLAPLEAELEELKATLIEHQALAADAAKRATVEITKLAQAGVDVSALVAVVTDVATPIKQREINAKQAEIEAIEAELAAKQAELEQIKA